MGFGCKSGLSFLEFGLCQCVVCILRTPCWATQRLFLWNSEGGLRCLPSFFLSFFCFVRTLGSRGIKFVLADDGVCCSKSRKCDKD